MTKLLLAYYNSVPFLGIESIFSLATLIIIMFFYVSSINDLYLLVLICILLNQYYYYYYAILDPISDLMHISQTRF